MIPFVILDHSEMSGKSKLIELGSILLFATGWIDVEGMGGVTVDVNRVFWVGVEMF